MKGQPSSIWVTIFVALATLPVKGGTQSFSNKDHDTLQLRQELATSFGQRNRALKSGYLSIHIYEWNVQHDSQQGKQATNNTYGIFSRITNHVGSIPMFLQGQCEGEQYHDRFLALLQQDDFGWRQLI